ncbi:MAG: UxaA family hydrolase [Chloroflexi bacterium]|nr:UxaA family hydrolase [Chloroflexota bacterium]
MKTVFVVYADDNVGTAVLEPISAGDTVATNGERSDIQVAARADIAYGHKIALLDISAGATVLKYGLSIGSATRDIHAGDHVHTHNVESNRGRGDLADS